MQHIPIGHKLKNLRVMHKCNKLKIEKSYFSRSRKVYINSEFINDYERRRKYLEKYKEKNNSFKGLGNTNIYYHSWQAKNPKGIVCILHGVNEHVARYDEFIKTFSDKDISFYALDHRGHGRSEGVRGHVLSFDEYIHDVNLLFNIIKKENPNLPIICLGHSMGGVIAIKYVLSHPDSVHALILSSAGLKPAVEAPAWKISLAKFLSKVYPSLTMTSGLDPTLLSRNSLEVKKYIEDPLIVDSISSRWYTEYIKNIEECMQRAQEIKLPILITHGTKDKIVDYHGSIEFYEKVSSSDKELELFEGLYHEPLKELLEDRKKVFKIISEWIVKHL